MAKRRFRIDSGYYGGEAVIGEVSNEFVKKTIGMDEGELVDTVLSFDDWGGDEEIDENAEHDDPEQIPAPREDYYMWECDDIEHINSAYGDSELTVFEVPADGENDYDYENEIGSFSAIHMYGREGGYFSNEEPNVVNEDDDEGNHYVPVLAFHSCEKGTFASYFVETDGEDFDQYKLGMGIVETNLGEFIDRVYYNKVELDAEYEQNDSTGKSYHAEVGWLNKKWHDSDDKYNELDEDYLQDFDDNAEWEREQNGE